MSHHYYMRGAILALTSSALFVMIASTYFYSKALSMKDYLEVGEMDVTHIIVDPHSIRNTAGHDTAGHNTAGHGSGGHVLTLKFTGQQVAGMRGLFSQQCWLNSFELPMSIVEPFLMGSGLVHSSEIWEEEEEGKQQAKNLKLSNLYKIPSGGNAGISLTSWDMFLGTSARKLIVVNVVITRKCLHSPSCSQNTSHAVKQNCQSLAMTTDSMAYLEAQGFQVVRRVCLNCSISEIGDFSPHDLTEHLFGSYKPQDVTLLFSHWKFSFQITADCKPCPEMTEMITPQTQLNEDAVRYIDVIDNLQNRPGERIGTTIAIMVRLEWFLIQYRNESLEQIQNCLQNVIAVKDELLLKFNSSTRILLALDVGKFGSMSFNTTRRIHHITHSYFERIQSQVKDLVLQMYNGRLSYDKWEESFVTATGSTDRGYIAALQSAMASRADCLVLMGGGHFQVMTLHNYKSHTHVHQCVHKVCAW